MEVTNEIKEVFTAVIEDYANTESNGANVPELAQKFKNAVEAAETFHDEAVNEASNANNVELEAAKEDLAKKEAALIELQANYDAIQAELNAANETIEANAKEIESLNEAIEANEATIETANTQIAEMKEANEVLAKATETKPSETSKGGDDSLNKQPVSGVQMWHNLVEANTRTDN